jgi:hypothetical protein
MADEDMHRDRPFTMRSRGAVRYWRAGIHLRHPIWFDFLEAERNAAGQAIGAQTEGGLFE